MTWNRTACDGQKDRRQPPNKFGPATIRYRDVVMDHDRWQWHAETYAHRRVLLGISYAERTSPVDPAGIWFNEALVAEATERYERFYRKNRSAA